MCWEEHGAKPVPSSSHSKLEPGSAELSSKLGTTVAIGIKGKRLPLRKRRLVARLGCPDDEAPCRGRIVVKTRGKVRVAGKRRRLKLATARCSIAGGEARRVRASLGDNPRSSNRIVRLLRRTARARRARTIARVGDDAGNRGRVVKNQQVRMRRR